MSAPFHKYLIWPIKGLAASEITNTELAIRRIAVLSAAVGSYISDFDGLRVWWAELSLGQVEEIDKLEGVSLLSRQSAH